jgi:hypothetical protein
MSIRDEIKERAKSLESWRAEQDSKMILFKFRMFLHDLRIMNFRDTIFNSTHFIEKYKVK